MIFNDIIDNLNSIQPYITELSKFNETATFITNKSNDLLLNALEHSYIISSSSNYDNIKTSFTKAMSELDKEIRNQDFFKLGTTYYKIIDKYNTIFNPSESKDYNLPGESYSETVRLLILSVYNFNSAIQCFLTRDSNNIIKSYSILILRSKQFTDCFNKFYQLKSELNQYKNKLENTWDGVDSNSTLTIRFFRETINFSEINQYNKSIEQMYSTICRLLNIHSDDYILLPVKIETGSLYEKFKGKEVAISIFINILTLCYTIYHDNFSDISEISSQVEQANYIKGKLEVIELAQSQGIEIKEDSKEILEQEITKFINNSLTLTKNNTNIQINDNKIDLVPEQDLLKFLSESTRPQIERSND